MIAHLRGTLLKLDNGQAIIDVAGVGYLIFITDNTAEKLQKMQNEKKQVEIHIETHMREDHIHLFGFLNLAERDAFRMLASVQGVGNKAAMAILQAINLQDLQTAFLVQDSDAFIKIPGIGKKLATRIISELKDKTISEHVSIAQTSSIESSVLNDSLSALVNLGYDKRQAYQALTDIIQNNENADTPEILRLALQKLAKN